MGLDMYAFTTPTKPATPVDFKVEEAHELHYWRKHPDLHGWMQDLYYAKGGRADDFNCVPVALTTEDLDQLEAVVRSNAMPKTRGFFFGASDGSETEDDLAFIAKARSAIADGMTVYYDSWW
jgi:hypothetical protein